MPEPKVGSGLAYEGPPFEIIHINPKLYDYLLMIHVRLFGIPTGAGDLDDYNVDGASLTGILHANLASITAFQHHGATGHDALLKATASTDASASSVSVSNNQSTVSVTTADADATYDSAEQNLINEIKADVNTLVSNFNTAESEIRGDVNTLVTDLNAIKTSLNDLKAKLRTANLLAT